jgi:hypothetical protein
MRKISIIALVTAAVVLSACGGDEQPLSSSSKPQVGKLTAPGATGISNEADAARKKAPSFETLLERQSSKPGSRFTPCLVTRAQAGAILGAPVMAPREAPQGPTCIYRTRKGNDFITLAVQPASFSGLKRQISRPHSIQVAGRSAFCGAHGQPMLYVRLARGRVLSVGAPCPVAKRFATRAVARLQG